ncbi:O-antigen polymerase [Thalassiella azotivora]
MNVVIVLGWLLPVLLAALFLQRRLLAPAPFFAAFWLVAVSAPLLLVPGAYVTAKGTAYVAAAVSLWVLGAAAASAAPGRPRFGPARRPSGPAASSTRRAPLDGTLLTRLVAAGTAAGFLAAVVALRRNGFDLGAVLSVDALLATGNAISVRRYAGVSGGGGLVSALLAVAYAGSLAAPFLLSSARPRRLLVAGPFVSVLAYSAFTTERLGLLLSGSFMVGGYLGMRLLRDGDLPRVTVRRALAAGASALAIAALFVAIAFIRVGATDATVQRVVLAKVEVYAFGYLPAFSRWLDEYHVRPSQPLGLGTASVAGVEFLTGQERDDTRAYSDRVVIDNQGNSTNVYTGFRSLLYDFGEAGSALLLVVAGFAATRAFRAARRGGAAAAAGLGAGYAVVLLSQTILITTFTNVVAGVLLGTWVVHRSGRRRQQLTPRGGGGRVAQPAVERSAASS